MLGTTPTQRMQAQPMTTLQQRMTRLVAFPALVLLAACSVDVRENARGEQEDVDIRTPVGDLSVRTSVEAPDTGLPVYPGARPTRDNDDSANVTIDTPFFGLDVVAATFESDDAPDAILAFYRNEMKTYGGVTECRGDIDFKWRRGANTPVCKETTRERDVQLVVGTERRHRTVSVKPRGAGSEFAVVYVQTQGQS